MSKLWLKHREASGETSTLYTKYHTATASLLSNLMPQRFQNCGWSYTPFCYSDFTHGTQENSSVALWLAPCHVLLFSCGSHACRWEGVMDSDVVSRVAAVCSQASSTSQRILFLCGPRDKVWPIEALPSPLVGFRGFRVRKIPRLF